MTALVKTRTAPELIEHCASLLQHTRDGASVVRYLARHSTSAKLPSQLRQVRDLWCRKYGDAAVKTSVVYKRQLKSIEQYVERMLNEVYTQKMQQHWKDVYEDVFDFAEMSFAEQFSTCASRSTASYTGQQDVDAMLCKLAKLPVYVQDLHLGTYAAQDRRRQDDETSDSASSSDDAASDSDRSSDDDASGSSECSSLSSVTSSSPNRTPVRHGTAHRKVESVIEEMVQIMQYPRCKYFDLVCALAFMCGRSLADIVSLGQFSKGTGRAEYMDSIRFIDSDDSSSAYTLPLLCNAPVFLKALAKLRQMRPAVASDRRLVNNSHSKSGNTAVKRLLGDQYVFTDLRARYAAATFLLYGRAQRRPLEDWVQETVAGGSRIMSTPSFFVKCKHALQEMSS
jgi:hypothetical protein